LVGFGRAGCRSSLGVERCLRLRAGGHLTPGRGAGSRARVRAPAGPASERSWSLESVCPGRLTQRRSRSAPSRWAERHARRTRRCAPG
jgi:hypothetical protein